MTHILYFGRVTDISGMDREQVNLPETISTAGDLRHWLDLRFEASGAFLEPTIRIAVNNHLVFDTYPVKGGDEIALMPPVGGG